MHLLTALTLKNPGIPFRLSVIGAQGEFSLVLWVLMVDWLSFNVGIFVSMFWVAYFLSPRFCHRFVGYLEEEAVKTYTHCLEVCVCGVCLNHM